MALTASGDVPAVATDHVHRFYHSADDETLALRDVTLAVWPGEVVAVVGPSGSGKSSLLNCLSGADDPDGGTVTLFGERLSRRPEHERAALRARHIGVLRQSGNLFPQLTVGQNLRLVRSLARRRGSGPDGLLARLGIEHRAGARPDQLSGGETARAGLAMALANEPGVLIADEPTGELDAAAEGTVLDLLTVQAASGTAVLIASHSADVMARADRVLRLTDGRLEEP